MVPNEGPPAVRVGVLLPRQPDDLGAWLADGGAFEAAGADALWIDPVPEQALDPLALSAALAAVTFRTVLVTALPAAGGPPLAPTLHTLRRLSRDRLTVVAEPAALADLAGITPGLAVLHRLGGDPETFAHPTDGSRRWLSVPPPDGRAMWRATLLDAAEQNCGGVLVPAGPRLLDILRNPGDPEERRDLQLAVG